MTRVVVLALVVSFTALGCSSDSGEHFDATPGCRNAETVARPADATEREALIRLLESQMRAAAEELDFELAALLRDQLLELKAGLDPSQPQAREGRRAAARGRTQPVR